jgi:hypothetical protein
MPSFLFRPQRGRVGGRVGSTHLSDISARRIFDADFLARPVCSSIQLCANGRELTATVFGAAADFFALWVQLWIVTTFGSS